MVVHYLRGAGWYHVLTILFRFSFSHLRIHNIIYFIDVRTLEFLKLLKLVQLFRRRLLDFACFLCFFFLIFILSLSTSSLHFRIYIYFLTRIFICVLHTGTCARACINVNKHIRYWYFRMKDRSKTQSIIAHSRKMCHAPFTYIHIPYVIFNPLFNMEKIIYESHENQVTSNVKKRVETTQNIQTECPSLLFLFDLYSILLIIISLLTFYQLFHL